MYSIPFRHLLPFAAWSFSTELQSRFYFPYLFSCILSWRLNPYWQQEIALFTAHNIIGKDFLLGMGSLIISFTFFWIILGGGEGRGDFSPPPLPPLRWNPGCHWEYLHVVFCAHAMSKFKTEEYIVCLQKWLHLWVMQPWFRSYVVCVSREKLFVY